MSKNYCFKILALGSLAFVLLFGATANLYAAGPEPGANDQIGQGRIVAVFTAVFVPDLIELAPGIYQDGFQAIIAGECNAQGTKGPVALDPLELPVDSEDAFVNATAADIDNNILLEQGPANCFSEAGGEDLIVTQVKNFYNSESLDGTKIIGAEITLRPITTGQ
jgi:hypothetical protein